MSFSPNDTIIGVKNPSKLGGIGGGSTINISINALDSKSIDKNTIDKITKAVEDGLKKGFGRRTTEAIGI